MRAEGERLIEGGTHLHVPRSGHAKGPKTRRGGPFYNPAMRLARDVSVALAAVEARDKPSYRFLDAMAAVGARGVRIANEVGDAHVTLADVNPAAVEWVRRNVDALDEARVDVHEGRFEALTAEGGYHWVDIDPFGTPAPFIDAGVRGVRSGGILAVTATDTATLNGVYPEACRRRYDARPMKAPFSKELALRLLAGAVVRTAARHDRAASPILCYARDHYVRLHLRIEDGAQKADNALGRMGYAWTDGKERGVAAKRPADAKWAGPLWTGPFVEGATVDAVLTEARTRGFGRDVEKLLVRLVEEAEAPALFVTMAEIGRAGVDPLPRIDGLVDDLRAAGHAASRTHFDPQGVKTDAEWDAMIAAAAG